MVEEKHGVPPGIGEIYAVLEFFIKYNPGADPEAIDWSIWDPRLPLELALKRLEETYPGYIWRPPSPPMYKPPPARAERPQPIRPGPRPIRLEPRKPGIPPLGIGAGGCACGYGYHRRYALEPIPDPMRRERPERRASIMGIPLLPRGARGWRAGLIMFYRIFLLMVAIPVFLLFMAFSRD